jgi:hypothetical protein
MNDKPRSLGFFHLLGGCLTIPNNVKAVKIELTAETIGFKYGFKSPETYRLEHVTASVETQQQISSRVTASRLLATGIFAFALKKQTAQLEQFLHISVDEPGRVAEIVFDTDKAPMLANEINAARGVSLPA